MATAETSSGIPRRESIKAALTSQPRRRSSAAAARSRPSTGRDGEEDLGTTTSSGDNDDDIVGQGPGSGRRTNSIGGSSSRNGTRTSNTTSSPNGTTTSPNGATTPIGINTTPNDINTAPNGANSPNGTSHMAGPDDNDEDFQRLENIGDYNPHLMAYLDNSDDGNSFAIATSSEDEGGSADSGPKSRARKQSQHPDDDLDESVIEAEEEQAIRSELKRKSRAPSLPGPVSLSRLSHSHTGSGSAGSAGSDRSRGSDRSDSSPSSDGSDVNSESSSWGNDFLEDYFDQPQLGQHQVLPGSFSQGPDGNDDSGNDDSYLWQYFFSSDEEELSNLNPLLRAKNRRASRSKQQQLHAGAGPAAAAQDSKHGDRFYGFSPARSQLSLDGAGGALEPGLGGADDEDGQDGSTDDDLPLKGRGPLPAGELAKQGTYIPSGDSTDEDDGVPPERKRKRARGSKAIEVLGANSFSARPPVLGSWRIRGDKNVGIIDGLTTRTLSPPAPPPPLALPLAPSGSAPSSAGGDTPQGGAVGETPRDPFEGLGEPDFTDFGDTPTRGGSGSGPSPHGIGLGLGDDPLAEQEGEVSDLDLLELGDFINTENMSSDDNDRQVYEFDLLLGDPQAQQAAANEERQFRTPAVSPYLYRNRLSNRNAPVAAFRNRASPYVHNPAYSGDSYSPAPRRRRSSVSRRSQLGRDAAFSSFSPHITKKRNKKLRSGSISGARGPIPGSANPLHDFADNNYDFIGELIEIGAISPLYENPME